MSSIIRIEKNPDNPYVMIDKRPLQDKRLSCKAKGLLAYLLSLPDDWKIHVDEITSHFTDGRDSIRTAFKELRDAGYATLERLKEGGSRWTVHEKPRDGISGGRELPMSENPTLLSTHSPVLKKNNKKEKEAEESLTLPYLSEAFKETWELWEGYRKKRKFPLNNYARRLQFKKALAMGEEATIQSIEDAISASYRDFYGKTPQNAPQSRLISSPHHGGTQGAKRAPEARQAYWMNELWVVLEQISDNPENYGVSEGFRKNLATWCKQDGKEEILAHTRKVCERFPAPGKVEEVFLRHMEGL